MLFKHLPETNSKKSEYISSGLKTPPDRLKEYKPPRIRHTLSNILASQKNVKAVQSDTIKSIPSTGWTLGHLQLNIPCGHLCGDLTSGLLGFLYPCVDILKNCIREFFCSMFFFFSFSHCIPIACTSDNWKWCFM